MLRPTANRVDDCYELVDYSIPLDDAREEDMNVYDSISIVEAEGYLSPPVECCVVLPVRESQQIVVQPDDVVGYYVDHFRDGDGAVTVYYVYIEDIARVDIKTKHNLPWLTTNIVRHIRKRNTMFQKAKRSKKESHYDQFKKLRNTVSV